jgi:hypothetical protein
MHLGKYAFGGAPQEILSSGSSCRNSSIPGIYQGFMYFARGLTGKRTLKQTERGKEEG